MAASQLPRVRCPSCCPVCGTHYVVIVLAQDCAARDRRTALTELAADITESTPPDCVVRTR